ncbi:MAG: hypothetical protein ACRYHQ_03620 [Janthinobacterium lividum]
MIAEKFVEYYGGLIALFTPVVWFLNKFVVPRFKDALNGWTSSKRNSEVRTTLTLFKAAQQARADSLEMRSALSYVSVRLTQGRIEWLCGVISYIAGSALITQLAAIKLSLLRFIAANNFNLVGMYGFPLLLSLLGGYLLVRSQGKIFRAARVRDAVCGRVGFLDKTTKRLHQLKKSGAVDSALLNDLENEIEGMRKASTVDWLALM